MINGSINSVAGWPSIHLAKRETGLAFLKTHPARFRKGCLGSNLCIRNTFSFSLKFNSISGGNSPDSRCRAEIGVVLYTGRIALALFETTLCRREMWPPIRFEISRSELMTLERPGHHVSAPKYAIGSMHATTA